MRMHPYRLLPALLAVLILAVSCSTTRVIPEGEYRLAKNAIEITNSKKFDPSSLNQYIKQQPNSTLFGWNPFMSIYNWADPDKETGMANVFRAEGDSVLSQISFQDAAHCFIRERGQFLL